MIIGSESCSNKSFSSTLSVDSKSQWDLTKLLSPSVVQKEERKKKGKEKVNY